MIEQQPLICASLLSVPGRQDRWETQECNRPAEHKCVQCVEGLCIRCEVTCYECGGRLHEECRTAHAECTGHDVDGLAHQGGLGRISAKTLIALLDQEIDRISVIVDGRL